MRAKKENQPVLFISLSIKCVFSFIYSQSESRKEVELFYFISFTAGEGITHHLLMYATLPSQHTRFI